MSASRAVVLACGLLQPFGCTFDSGGVPARSVDLAAAEAAREMTADELPILDLPPAPDARRPDVRRDMYLQGTTCQTAKGSIEADQPPLPCGKVTLVVVSAETTWVMAGVAAGPSPAKASYTWKGSAEVLGGCPAQCAWRYVDVDVPCASGPYTFGFMDGAENDDWSKGTIRITCQP